MDKERDFKGVWIPREIWLAKDLNILDKIILMEIDSLSRNDDNCYASNDHLAEFCQCSERKVSEAVSKLIGLKYVEFVSYDGRKRLLRSRLAKFASQSSRICESESQNLRNSNNNEYINTKTNSNKRFIIPTLEEVKQYCTDRHNTVDANKFMDYYTSNGWRVGRNAMKDWKAAVRTWEKSSYGGTARKENPSKVLSERDYDSKDFDEWTKVELKSW